MKEPRAVFQALLDGVTGKKWSLLPELYAEDCVVEHPFLGFGQRMEGRDRIRKHFEFASGIPLQLRARNVVVHQTVDPEVIVAEFEYHGEVTTTGRTFVAPCIFVMRVRDGLIVESRDYANHLALAYVSGRVPELLSMLEKADS
ncbi:MAG TPA: nuclear transport factor 2 family protein [Actinopolymorphaceae bacterium]